MSVSPQDVNDFAPVFGQPTYRGMVAPNAVKGTVVATVMANDSDPAVSLSRLPAVTQPSRLGTAMTLSLPWPRLTSRSPMHRHSTECRVYATLDLYSPSGPSFYFPTAVQWNGKAAAKILAPEPPNCDLIHSH